MTPPSARGGVTAGLETFCRAERTFAIGPAVVAHEARDVNFGVPLMLKTVRSTIIFIVISSLIGFLLGTLGIDGLTRATISIGFASVAAMILNVTWAKRAQQQVDGAEKSELLARAAAADRSVILFFREGFNGKLAGVDVGVDDAIVAQLGTPAGTRVAVMPGQRKLSARTAGNMGGKPGVLTIDVRPGETLAVQIKMGIGTIKLLPQSDTNAVRHRMSGMTIVRPEKDEA